MDIYEEIVRIRQRGERAAVATIIARKGSIPRKDAANIFGAGHISHGSPNGPSPAWPC